jgi:hypothetical protein
MKKFSKAILWMLPLLATVAGYAFAYAHHYGLLETWQFVGRPDENIVQIIGIQEGVNYLFQQKLALIIH